MPTIDIPDKICPHCGGIRWDVLYHENGKIKKIYCSNKRLDNERKRRTLNYKKIYIQQKSWAEKNSDKCKEASKKYYCKNKNARLSYHKLRNKKPEIKEAINAKTRERIAKLTDGIVRNMIKHQFGDKSIKASDIPQDLIKLKRTQLSLIRQLKLGESSAN
jgi:hypothetical protein